MLNSTIMGPMYSLSETFTKMNDKDLDFGALQNILNMMEILWMYRIWIYSASYSITFYCL